jgi:hypothetical protein
MACRQNYWSMLVIITAKEREDMLQSGWFGSMACQLT